MLPENLKEYASHGGRTICIGSSDGGPLDVGAVPDPLTWRVDEFDTTEYAVQCLKATEVAGSSAPFLGHNLYHIHRDELGEMVPNGCISDSDGFLYLQEDAMPLVIFRLEPTRFIKIPTSPRSTNESEGGRELENLPVTAVEFQAKVTAVLLLGGFTDELVKEAAQLARNNDPAEPVEAQ